MRKRTKAREFALKILYQADMTRREAKVSAENFWNEIEAVDKTVKKFANNLVLGAGSRLEEIDEKITTYATNWQMKRMAAIDRNLLRLGVYELLYCPDVPPKVTINEAVELAKRYGDTESSKFVNGILDKIHKTELIKPEVNDKPGS